jgi:hypothetical protein
MLARAWHTAKVCLSRPPADYRPGALLQHLRGDLAGFEVEWLAPARARFATPGFEFQVAEIVEPQMLMHVVSSEFSCRYRAAAPAQRTRISARHRGAWRRTGVAFEEEIGASQSLLERLAANDVLLRALATLDFTHWQLEGRDSGWQLTVRHFGASEVVGRMPAFRRYVRLERTQRDALLASMQAVGSML